MKLKIIIGFSILLTNCIINAQSNLYIPKEIQKAYKNQTRSKDGKPGEKYWQNTVDYKIDVTVTPATRLIDGKETVIFTNNSPNELSKIVVRLYYDVFKKGNKRGSRVNPKDIGEGVEISKITIDGVNFDLSSRDQIRRRGTNMNIKLSKPLKTGEQLIMEFEWKQKVPFTLERTGAIDSTSFFVGYWYPQVAVYDDVFGWDTIDYTLETEFYNNLANFNVNITAPNNFLVWATGTLENSKDVLPDEIYKKYEKAKTSKELVNIVTTDDLKELDLKSNTWNFKATEVTDFAFAMSDHYLWDALSQEVSGNDVLINSAFPMENAEQYKEVTKIKQKAMKHFSEEIPGIPYPYPVFSTFIGLEYPGSGMEFPMMANNGGPGIEVTIHELFHTYFPMYVRINERRFAWMDEGWADFMETLVSHKFFSDKNNTTSLYANFKLGVQGTMGTIGDLPTVTSSEYMGDNYGYHAYSLPSFTNVLLYQHLGEEKFLECLKAYILRWAKKSPTPYDFFYTFEDVSGEDLSFIWDSWYFRMGYPDVAIESFKNGNLVVKRQGERIVPVSVNVEYHAQEKGKKDIYTTIIGSSVWKDNKKTYALQIPKADKVKHIAINSDFPDFNEVDNYFPSLASRYKDLSIDNSILGVYSVNGYSYKIKIVKDEGVLSMDFIGIKTYLLPVDDNSFVSTDGTITLTFKENTKNKKELEMYMSIYDWKITGEKKENFK